MEARTSRNFLIWIGYIMVILGILGFIHVLGPSAQNSIFGQYWWMDSRVSLIYIVLGLISLFTAYIMAADFLIAVAFALGIVGFFVGLYGLFWSSKIFSVPLEGGVGNFINFLIGIWALYSVSGERISLMRRCRAGDTDACEMLGMNVR